MDFPHPRSARPSLDPSASVRSSAHVTMFRAPHAKDVDAQPQRLFVDQDRARLYDCFGSLGYM